MGQVEIVCYMAILGFLYFSYGFFIPTGSFLVFIVNFSVNNRL